MTSTEFVEWLEGLLQAPLPTAAEGEAWFRRNRSCLDRLSVVPALGDEFFHLIHHYISDVDVRRDDPGYRRDQDEALRKCLAAYQASIGARDP